jgi:hypothetical protein
MKFKLLFALMVLGVAFSAKAQYCTVSLDCTDDDTITNVTFAGINNTTTCSPGGYGNYTTLSPAQVTAGQAYPISVTVGEGWYERVSVWIDYNNNQTFETNEFLGEIGNGGAGVTVTKSITIPAGTATGNYRMRVLSFAAGEDEAASTDPCMNAPDNYGEYEDYTVHVTNNSLAVNEVSTSKENINIYPNPVVDSFEIKNSGEFKKLTLIDSSGKMVKSFDGTQKKYDISDLQPGVYILVMEGGKASKNMKIIKR